MKFRSFVCVLFFVSPFILIACSDQPNQTQGNLNATASSLKSTASSLNATAASLTNTTINGNANSQFLDYPGAKIVTNSPNVIRDYVFQGSGFGLLGGKNVNSITTYITSDGKDKITTYYKETFKKQQWADNSPDPNDPKTDVIWKDPRTLALSFSNNAKVIVVVGYPASQSDRYLMNNYYISPKDSDWLFAVCDCG